MNRFRQPKLVGEKEGNRRRSGDWLAAAAKLVVNKRTTGPQEEDKERTTKINKRTRTGDWRRVCCRVML